MPEEWRSALGNFDDKEMHENMRGRKGDKGDQGIAGMGFNVSDPVVQQFTPGTWFQPNTERSCMLHVNATLTGLLNASGAVKIETAATENGAGRITLEKVLTLLNVVLGMKDALPVIVKAGHWVKITPTGAGLTLTCVRWDL